MNDFLYIIVFRAIKHELGMSLNLYLRQKRFEFYDEQPKPHECYFCHGVVKRSERSVDHIIPQSICWELGLVNLIYDKRNFRLSHQKCNEARGNNLDELPESIKLRLEKIRSKKVSDASAM